MLEQMTRSRGNGHQELLIPAVAPWPIFTVELVTGLTVLAEWSVDNIGDLAGDVYMELEIIRPMWPSPQRLISTLPGEDRFSTEMDLALVRGCGAGIVTVPPGATLTVRAAALLEPGATPTPVTLDVQIRLREVVDPEATDPAHVGPVITDGEYSQDGVIVVVAPVGAAELAAIDLPDLFVVA